MTPAAFAAPTTVNAATDSGISKRDAAGIDAAQKYIESITPNNAPTSPLGFDTKTITDQKDVVPLAQSIIGTITGFLAAIAGTFALFMILLNAFRLITSNGDQKKIEGARGGILWSVLGLLGIMFSYLIIYTIVDTLFRIGSGTGF